MFKKVVLFSMLVLSFFALFASVTPLQMLPFFVLLFLGHQNVFNGSKNNTIIVFLSVFMLIINIAIFSVADIFVWTLCIVAFWKD